MKVFLSCVSTEFKSYRLKLANQLGALKDHPCEVKVQEDFQQGGFTLLDKLADYVRECEFVIHLAGDACGARPTPEHVRALFHSLDSVPPAALPEWSYTQCEYQLALHFERKTLVYLAAADAPRDCAQPIQQTDQEARVQQAHLKAIRQSGKHHAGFASYNTLVREVFHDLGLEPELKINNLPYKSLGSLFKGREEFLRKIHDTMGRVEHRGHQRFAAITASVTAVAVHGLGGIGKTRAAIEYAHHYAEEYTALLFVRADSLAGLQQNLAALCGPMVFDLPEKDANEIDVQVAAVLHWLQQHPAWLLIFDNSDTEEAAQAVQELLGSLTPAGQVLVTSRLSNWPGAVESLVLDVLEEADAAAFLMERTQARRRKTPQDDAQARTVAMELGRLALALEQAGAYIERHRSTFAEYLSEWNERRDKLLAFFDERVMQYPMSVAITWQTSFDGLVEPARRLLRILAWLASDPIPEWLLETADGPFASAKGKRVKTRPDAREALADLEAHSLVTRSGETPTFSIHRLVLDVTRHNSPSILKHRDLKAALRWVDAAFVGHPQDVRTWSVLVPLASHALVVAGHADAAEIRKPTAKLMNALATLYLTRAKYYQAEPLLRRALALCKKSFGGDQPEVATLLSNLAQSLQATNRIEEAERLLRQALAIKSRALGRDHPDVAAYINNLARLLQDTNRLQRAEPLMRQALAISQSAYGHYHGVVALYLNNLARLLHDMNRLDEAEPLMRQALKIDENAKGANDPDVASDLNNLAGLLKATNRLGEAEPLMRRALAIDEHVYGSDHPKVATDLNSLAGLLYREKRLGEAESLYRRALAIDEHAYGRDHTKVALRLSNLAGLLSETKRLHEAEPLMRRAVAINEQSYQPDHRQFAASLWNLASLLQATDRLPEAEPLMRRAVEVLYAFTRDTGGQHPQLDDATSDYAELLDEMGYPEKQILARLQEIATSYGFSVVLREGPPPTK